MHELAFPVRYSFPLKSPKKLFQIVLSTIIQQVGDHTHFVQEEPLALQYLTKIWATCVEVDVPKFLDNLILEASII